MSWRLRPHARRPALCLFACALGLLVGQVAHAGSGIASTKNATAQLFSDADAHTLDLGDEPVFVVETEGPARVLIHFTAECAVDASGDGTWLLLTITVDDEAVTPTGGDLAFCTSRANTSYPDDDLGNWVGASADAVFEPSEAGSYEIEVVGQLQNHASGDRWRIDDLTLIVVVQE